MAVCAKLAEMYHNQQSIDGESPSAIENKLRSDYFRFVLISAIKNSAHLKYGQEGFATTTDSVITQNFFSIEAEDSIDNLIDEVGEAECDRAKVGIDSEDYALDLEGLDLAGGYNESDEDKLYAPLELSPNEMYLNSLLDTEIDVAKPYDSKSRRDVAGIQFYEVSYYDVRSADEIIEPEGERTELEAIFTVSTVSVDDSEPDEEPNYNQKRDLEARLQ